MSIIEKKRQALEKKANAGDARAQYELGLVYYRGEGVAQDMPMARHWLTKAAEQGDRDARVLLNLRGMQLNQGVEFKFGSGRSTPAVSAQPIIRDQEKDLYTTEPTAKRSADELKQGLTLAMLEAERILPGQEPLRDRIIAGLNSMLKAVESRRMPARESRGLMTLTSVVQQGLSKYEGARFESFKSKVVELSRWFETIDLDPPMIVKPKKRSADGDKFAKVASIADQIEAELRRLGWWSEATPTAEQMDFKAAFGMDTMALGTWIQFVLLPRVRSIIKDRGSFPSRSMVGAHAVREYDGQHDASELVSLLSLFDETVESR